MAIRMVVGRAGTGKTALCHREIVAALRAQPLGPPIYWVVPRQATFSTERWLACDSGLAASARCRVVSFERLAEEVLAEHPGPTRAVLSATARRAVVAQVLRENADRLSYFGAVADRPGLVGEVIAVLDELAREGHLGDDEEDRLARAAAELEAAGHGSDSPLVRKVRDLAVIRSAYEAFLGPTRFDKDRRMKHVLGHVGACRRLRGASFVVDGFLELMDFERRMLLAVSELAEWSGGSVTVTLCVPPDSPVVDAFDRLPEVESLFHRTESTYRALRLMFREAKLAVRVEALQDPVRAKTQGLCRVEAVFAGQDAGQGSTEGGGSVERFEAESIGAEVAGVVRRIRELTTGPSAAYRWRDIVVLARDLAPYETALVRAFEACGIGVVLDRRVDASGHPLVRVVRWLLEVAACGVSSESVMGLVRTGLLPGMSAGETATLARWVAERRIGAEVWATAPEALAAPVGAPRLFDELRERVVPALVGWAKAWGGTGTGPVAARGGSAPAGAGRPGAAMTARTACVRLAELVVRLGVGTVLAEREREAAGVGGAAREGGAGEAQATEDRQVWEELFGEGKLLEELADALGEAEVSATDFRAMMRAALGDLDLGQVPPTVDQVLVGTADRTRPGNARVAFVLGLSDGLFPAEPAESHLLPDRERETLKQAKLPLQASADRAALDERLVAYLAMTRASERLIVSRPLADGGGRPLRASRFWSMLDGLCEDRSAAEVAAGYAPLAEVVGEVAQWAALGADMSEAGQVAAYGWLQAASAAGGEAARLVRAVWPSLRRECGSLKLPADVAAALYPDGVEVTAERLARFAACPFQHHVREVLRPKDAEPPRVTRYTVFDVAGGMFGRVLTEVIKARGEWTGMDAAAMKASLRHMADQLIEDKVRRMTFDGSADEGLLPAGDRHQLQQARTAIDDLIEAEIEAAGRTAFRPEMVGVRYGGGGKLAGLRVELTKAGRAIEVRGRLARVDKDPDGRQLVVDFDAFRVKGSGLTRLYLGLRLTLLVHLLVLRQAFPDRQLAGAVGLPLRRGYEAAKDYGAYVKERDGPAEEKRARRRLARGVLSETAASSLDATVQAGASSVIFQLARNKDGRLNARSDTLTPTQWEGLLLHGQTILADLGEAMAGGDISVRPYKLGNTSACVKCGYRAICRFDPRAGGKYRPLESIKADEVRRKLDELAAEGGGMEREGGAT